jgi:succinoglycan biosynthesis transport protein ExoP
MLGLLGGLAVGIALVYAADALDPSIKTVDQAEAVIGLPVLAIIPESKDDPKKQGNKREQTPRGAASYRPVADDPGGMAAEAFRNLRAALSLLGPEADRKIFLFTSALPKEGKSFTGVNYALALAQQGHRVLLIDGDLRYPNLHKVFRPASTHAEAHDSLGIVDYLVAKADLAQAARPVSVSEIEFVGNNIADAGNGHPATGGQLNVLTGGHCAPNPAEILSGPRFAELLAEASRLYDRVVVDSAPVLAVSDTLLMTPFIQTVCMVVRARKTPLNAVRRAVELLASAGVRPAGLILNRLPKGLGQGYYYYYYASTDYGPGEGSYHRGETSPAFR